MNKFLFFQGFIYNTRIEAETDLVDTLSQRINQEIDNEIIRTLTREVNGDEDNLRYFNRWLSIGNNRA
jgi:hypothetical protein